MSEIFRKNFPGGVLTSTLCKFLWVRHFNCNLMGNFIFEVREYDRYSGSVPGSDHDYMCPTAGRRSCAELRSIHGSCRKYTGKRCVENFPLPNMAKLHIKRFGLASCIEDSTASARENVRQKRFWWYNYIFAHPERHVWGPLPTAHRI